MCIRDRGRVPGINKISVLWMLDRIARVERSLMNFSMSALNLCWRCSMVGADRMTIVSSAKQMVWASVERTCMTGSYPIFHICGPRTDSWGHPFSESYCVLLYSTVQLCRYEWRIFWR